jgi:predicted DNA-binding transcriptional regulator AlpA
MSKKTPPRLICKAEVLDRIGLSYPTVWNLMRRNEFPRAREMGGKTVWIESEVDAWILSRPIRRLKGDEVVAA